MANQYVVVGPYGGYYHVGTYASDGRFYSAQQFTNKDSADLTAYRMNQVLMAGVSHGR